MALSDKLKPVPPKKLLSLDGGGIRGVITLEILARIEDILRQTKGMGNPGFRLADYFDYIAGTSTGAIIAACLSIGMSVSEISHFYHSFSKEMFTPAGYLKRLRYKYEDDKLSAQLKEVLGASTTLGSDTVRTLLMMVMRNATTDSPWRVRRVGECLLAFTQLLGEPLLKGLSDIPAHRAALCVDPHPDLRTGCTCAHP